MSSIFKLPFPEAEAFFKDKLNIPTERWNDLMDEEHAKAFMSAGANKADLLAGLRDAVDKGINGKMSLPDFQKQFDALVAKHGWQYQGSRNWRSELIWSQNIITAYQAGRWQQFADSDCEYLIYKHQDGLMYPRPTHVAWNNTVLPKDHPWWDTHFASNGYGCHCRIYRANKSEYDNAPNKGDRPDNVPADEGFNYNPGKDAGKGYEPLLKKFEKLPVDIAQLWMESFLQSPTFERFYQQKIPANFPVAALNPKDKTALGAKTQTVWFSPQSLEEHLTKHPDITLEDYQKIQLILSEGEVYQNPNTGERLTYLMIDGKLYRAGVKTTADKEENFFLTLFETTEEKNMNEIISKYKKIR